MLALLRIPAILVSCNLHDRSIYERIKEDMTRSRRSALRGLRARRTPVSRRELVEEIMHFVTLIKMLVGQVDEEM